MTLILYIDKRIRESANHGLVLHSHRCGTFGRLKCADFDKNSKIIANQ